MKALHLLPRILFLLILSLPVVLIILVIDKQANTQQNPTLDKEQITSIQQLLIDHDPRQLIDTDNQAVQLTESEVNALLNYFKSSFLKNKGKYSKYINLENIALNTNLTPGTVTLSVTLPISSTPFGNYLNLSILAVQDGDFIHIDSIKVGALSIPTAFHKTLFSLLEEKLADNSNYLLFNSLLKSVKQILLEQDQLNITLNWQTDNLNYISSQARNIFISPEEALRLKYYHNKLAEISKNISPDRAIASLNDFFQPMFSIARDNSAAGADPLIENRAIFITVAAYLNKLDLELLIGPVNKDELDSPNQLKVRFESRADIPQHIAGSAAIAASAGAELANILSIYKEVHDSRYRSSGFSFSDITANRAGTRLGTLSSQNHTQALRLQELMSQSKADSDFMPSVKRYDGLTEQEFIQRYQNRQSESYLLRLTEIDQEISQRPLFKQL